MLLIDQNNVFTESDAFLHIMRQLGLPFKLCQLGLYTPHVMRDPLYRIIAKNRYRWFGKTEHCLVPHPQLKQHFLEHYLHV